MEKDNMAKTREIPRKNYYLLLLLSALTLFIVCYLANWYQARQDAMLNRSVISEVISEVKEEELSNYLLDNPNVVVYFSTADEQTKSFEKQLKKLILKYEMTNEIVFVNTSVVTEDNFYENIVNRYFDQSLKNKKIGLNYLPNMMFVKDGKVKDVLVTYETEILISEVEHFFHKNGVIES